jgi:(1->4)-alpha-D-glucan 1-alpha-D-glucosylmutase
VDDELLRRLARRHGILTAYDDIWGRQHEASGETLVALLAEMDVDAASDESLAASLRALDDADRRTLLPPVLAVAAGHARWSVPLGAPAARATLRWTLTLEDGSTAHGERHAAAAADAERLEIEQPLPMGYHRLAIDGEAVDALVVAAPARCFRPAALADDGRIWGPALQLYALRSRRNWGIGDFGDLLSAVEHWAAHGAEIVGVNPLHALFPHNPLHASPYSPSSRLQLNTLYIDVEAVEDFAECETARERVASAAFQRRLAELRGTERVDYVGVAAAKDEILRLLHGSFVVHHAGRAASDRARDFDAFVAEGGEALRRHALHEAIQEHLHAADASIWGPPVWPDRYRSPESAAVERFAAKHADAVGYRLYLQWLADRQLGAVDRRCRALAMAGGLYLDLAVSVDRAGSDVWGHADVYARGASIGAPPDDANLKGQGWGLPPLRPDRSRQSGHALFIATLRASMRRAGVLRIDHVLGLMRMYWIPPDRPATEGAYVRYPLDELMAIVALESERQRCMVIGEDLGTVTDEIRAAMSASEMLSYRLLYFERSDDGAFRAPADYPRRALVAVSTHDLPTLAGWWSGHDLAVRRALSLFPSDVVHEQQLAARAEDRVHLLLALERAGVLPAGIAVELDSAPKITAGLIEAVHAYIAATPAQVMLVQLEDALGIEDQANLPGTVGEHPNWQKKLPVDLDALAADAAVSALARRIAALRPRTGAAAQARREAVIPRATYRLQFHREFDFDAAIGVLPYLQRLGVSHVYCSPILRARRGSTHGYDVVAHDEINPELGGSAGFERFTAALQRLGMGQLLDVVPNHMGVLGADNAWWMDVLENGPSSAYSRHFDIDWHPANRQLAGKVLVPVLGDHYGDVLDAGELRLVFEPGGSFALRYHEHRFPLDPRSYAVVLVSAASLAGSTAAEQQLQSLAAAFGHLPATSVAHASDEGAERQRDKELLKARLAALAAAETAIASAVDGAVALLNAPARRDDLHALHEQQPYRLAFWRVAADEINYRRFFDINELAALRMEDPAVFEATHAFSLDLAAAGKVDGLRIDHPDGLQDPARYFERLQQGYARRVGIAPAAATAGDDPSRWLYVVAEKIAATHEDVPRSWPIHGATGYRFAMVANGVLVDGAAADEFEAIWRRYSGETRGYGELVREAKHAVTETGLASELAVLATALLRIAQADRHTRDYTFKSLSAALADVAACLPVYRTYIVEQPSAQDDRYIDWALAHARRRSRLADHSIFDFVGACLRNHAPPGADAARAAAVHQFALRFQQFSAPVAAKGVEDTAFYRYLRLVSLNEVGGDPSVFGVTVRAFHGASADRAGRWRHTLLATSTHDNKRSGDVRNRINVLSEMPAAWAEWIDHWRELASSLRSADADGAPLPSAADEYLLWQTLLGTLPAEGLDDAGLPAYRERIAAYMQKAAREAKRRTSWTRPDEEYEKALQAFVAGVLARVRPNPLLSDVQSRVATVAWFGALNSLSTLLLKYTSPGVPDLYQGNELLELSLVDPDNRRPVDYALRGRLLDELETIAASHELPTRLREIAAAPHDGRAKLWLTWRLLALRARHPEAFRDGGYAPLTATGARSEHVVAFARPHDDALVVTIAGRLFARLLGEELRLPVGGDVWLDTAVPLPEGVDADAVLENVVTGERVVAAGGQIPVGLALANFPAAALVVATRR